MSDQGEADRRQSASGRRLRHATGADLDALDEVLQALRGIPGLRERKRGSFSRGARALVHFHAGDGSFYADVRLEERFERISVTTAAERSAFLLRVRKALGE